MYDTTIFPFYFSPSWCSHSSTSFMTNEMKNTQKIPFSNKNKLRKIICNPKDTQILPTTAYKPNELGSEKFNARVRPSTSLSQGEDDGMYTKNRQNQNKRVRFSQDTKKHDGLSKVTRCYDKLVWHFCTSTKLRTCREICELVDWDAHTLVGVWQHILGLKHRLTEAIQYHKQQYLIGISRQPSHEQRMPNHSVVAKFVSPPQRLGNPISAHSYISQTYQPPRSTTTMMKKDEQTTYSHLPSAANISESSYTNDHRVSVNSTHMSPITCTLPVSTFHKQELICTSSIPNNIAMFERSRVCSSFLFQKNVTTKSYQSMGTLYFSSRELPTFTPTISTYYSTRVTKTLHSRTSVMSVLSVTSVMTCPIEINTSTTKSSDICPRNNQRNPTLRSLPVTNPNWSATSSLTQGPSSFQSKMTVWRNSCSNSCDNHVLNTPNIHYCTFTHPSRHSMAVSKSISMPTSNTDSLVATTSKLKRTCSNTDSLVATASMHVSSADTNPQTSIAANGVQSDKTKIKSEHSVSANNVVSVQKRHSNDNMTINTDEKLSIFKPSKHIATTASTIPTSNVIKKENHTLLPYANASYKIDSFSATMKMKMESQNLKHRKRSRDKISIHTSCLGYSRKIRRIKHTGMQFASIPVLPTGGGFAAKIGVEHSSLIDALIVLLYQSLYVLHNHLVRQVDFIKPAN